MNLFFLYSRNLPLILKCLMRIWYIGVLINWNLKLDNFRYNFKSLLQSLFENGGMSFCVMRNYTVILV